MHVVISGATGLVGRVLTARLHEHGYDIVALTRNPDSARETLGDLARPVAWDGRNFSSLTEHVEGAAAVVNLAGENIGQGRWTAARRKSILQSRLDATESIVQAIEKTEKKPGVLIQASAIGFYGSTGDSVAEESEASGTGFLADVCRRWEAASLKVEDLGVRRVLLRTGIVLSHKGGALPEMVAPIKSYVGGVLGTGRQWISWVHVEDVAHAVEFLIDSEELRGPVHITAPNPATNAEITRRIASHLKKPAFLKVPAIALKAAFGRDFAEEMLLGGRKVLPATLERAGFRFEYPDLETALTSLLSTL